MIAQQTNGLDGLGLLAPHLDKLVHFSLDVFTAFLEDVLKVQYSFLFVYPNYNDGQALTTIGANDNTVI